MIKPFYAVLADPERDARCKALLDEGYKHMRELLRIHSQEAMWGLINAANAMQELGYDMIWYKSRRILAARRKDGTTLEEKNLDGN